jgi:hypothetical protein
MPVAVKIKAGKYGSAIGLLLVRGGAFQTRHERMLVETNGLQDGSGKEHGHKKDAD